MDVPYLDFNLPIAGGPRGFGDLTAGWGIVLHENETKRLTSAAAVLEVLADR